MNFCRNDIYFILIFLVLGYLLYKDLTKKEGFDATSDANDAINNFYKADIEAIRNLSSIATELTKNNTLIMPGNLNVKGALLFNNAIEHPDTGDGAIYNGQGQLHIAADDNIYFRSSSTKQNKIHMDVNNGNITANGNINANGDIRTDGGWLKVSGKNGIYFETYGGGWKMENDSWIETHGNKSLSCNGHIRARDMSTAGYMKADQNMEVGTSLKVGTDLTVGKSIKIGNTEITERHLQMLTDGFYLKNSSGRWNGHFAVTFDDSKNIAAGSTPEYKTTYKMERP